MKQRDLVKKLEEGGFIFERHGSNHDVYVRELKEKKFQDTRKLMKNWQKRYYGEGDCYNPLSS